jgi:hypothetical protein
MLTIRKATKDETPKGVTMYIASRNGKDVAVIRKPKNTRHDIYPWSVYAFGDVIALARFYDYADSVKIGSAFDYDKCQTGGKTAAFVFARQHFA